MRGCNLQNKYFFEHGLQKLFYRAIGVHGSGSLIKVAGSLETSTGEQRERRGDST